VRGPADNGGSQKKVTLLTVLLDIRTWRSGYLQTGTDYLFQALGTLTR
jgi:hypothetical protein